MKFDKKKIAAILAAVLSILGALKLFVDDLPESVPEAPSAPVSAPDAGL